jgi:hypothetical protein
MSCNATVRPSDDMLILAMLVAGPRWLWSDEIRGILERLGWDVTSQWVGGRLSRLAREDAPMVEGRDEYGTGHAWAVTRWGRNQIENRFPTASRRWEIVETSV